MPFIIMKLSIFLLKWAILAMAQSQSDSTTESSSSSSLTPPAPSTSTAPGQPFCECGYTYCSSVLMGMSKHLRNLFIRVSDTNGITPEIPWNEAQLTDAYCKTPNTTCTDKTPSTSIKSALFICLCDGADQKEGDTLHLVCGCDTCLNIGPDFRGRCQTPCSSGPCHSELSY